MGAAASLPARASLVRTDADAPCWLPCRPQDLRDAFYHFGELRSIRIVPGKDFAFVQFTTRQAAEAAAEQLYKVRVHFSWKPWGTEPDVADWLDSSRQRYVLMSCSRSSRDLVGACMVFRQGRESRVQRGAFLTRGDNAGFPHDKSPGAHQVRALLTVFVPAPSTGKWDERAGGA